MIKTMDLCNTGVGRRQKIGRGPIGEEILFFAVNWDPLMCCIYLQFSCRRFVVDFLPALL